MIKYLKNLFSKNSNSYRNNPSQEYLFIGGFNDGKKIFIPDNEEQVRLPNNYCFREIETYYKKLLCTQKSIIVVYIFDGLKDVDILEKLINNYRPGP